MRTFFENPCFECIGFWRRLGLAQQPVNIASPYSIFCTKVLEASS